MEKRVVLAMLLSVGLLMGWSALAQIYAPPPSPGTTGGTPVAQTGTAGAPTNAPIGTGGSDPAGNGDPAVNGGADVPDAPIVDAPAVIEELPSEHLDLTVDSKGAAVTRADVWSCEYHDKADGEVRGDPVHVTDYLAKQPGLLSVVLRDTATDLDTRNWAIEREGDVLRARTVADVGQGTRVEIIKTMTPSTDPAAPYHVDVDLELRGLGDKSRRVTVEVVGPWMSRPVTEVPGEDGVLLATGDGDGDSDVEILQPTEIAESLAEDAEYAVQAPDGIDWVGVRGDFHLGALAPTTELPSAAYIGFRSGLQREVEGGEPWRTAAATIRVPLLLPSAGETKTLGFRLYAGPASRPLMTEDGALYPEFAGAIPERWMTVPAITDVLAWLLTMLASTGMGYGLAVVCLTILVRGALFPLSRKSQISMRVHSKRMASIKPKMDAIKKRFKDPKKQQEETMKLMRQEKISPVPGGCLLAFVQMPIWISLYGILQTTYEMRHAKFLWAHDLTGPDHLLHMPWFENVPLVPEWLNLFPILMMITWGISSHMQPLPDDPQQRQTAKMMRWMPMMFGLILYNYASGLTIYMTCSALWSICEVQLIKRVWLNKLGV